MRECRLSPQKNLAWVVLLLPVLPGSLAAQTAVEHAVISGSVSAAAGSAKRAASAMTGALKNLDGTLDTAAKHPRSATTPAKSSLARASSSAKTYEDPVEIKTGIAYDDLLRRFGQPAMRITSEGGEQTLYYSQKDGRGQTQVRVSGGQVRSVDVGGKSAEAAAVK